METALEMLEAIMRRQEARCAHVILDDIGTILTWNPPLPTMLGWTREEAVGHALDDLIIPPDLREAHRYGLRRWKETTPSPVAFRRHLRTTALHKDGTDVPVAVDIQIVYEQDRVSFLGWVVLAPENGGTPSICTS